MVLKNKTFLEVLRVDVAVHCFIVFLSLWLAVLTTPGMGPGL